MNGRRSSTAIMFKNDADDDDLFLNDIGSLSQIYTKRELYGDRDRFKKPPAPKSAYWDHKKTSDSRNATSSKSSGDKTPGRGSRFEDDELFEARKSDKRPLYAETPRRFEPSDDYEPEIDDLEDEDERRTGSDDFEEPAPRLLASTVNNYTADMGDLPWRKSKTSVAADAPIYDFEESSRRPAESAKGSAQQSRSGAADDFSIEKASFGKWFEAEESKGQAKPAATELREENYPANVSSHYDAAFKPKQPVKLSLDGRLVEERSSQNGSLFGFKQREFSGASETAVPPPTPRRPQQDDDDIVVLDEAEKAAQSQQRRSRFSEDAAPAATQASTPTSSASAQYSFATPTSQASSAQQHIPILYPAAGAETAPAQSNVQSAPATDSATRFVVPQPQAVPNPQMVPPPTFAGANFRRPPGPPQGPPPLFVDAYRSHQVSALLGKSNFCLFRFRWLI